MTNIYDAMNQLPTSGMTITTLQTLDYVVPGEWENVTGFDDMIRHVTGESVPDVVAMIRKRAYEFSMDPEKHYGQALQVFQIIDTIDQVAAGAAVAGKVSDLFGGLGFLEKFTPKPETTQAIDAGLKLIAELLAFGLLHGMPEATFDGVARWVIALQDYGRSDIMRIAAWVAIDGILPLGPNFMQIITSTISDLASSNLAGNPIFKSISDKLPGDSPEDKQSFIVTALEAVSDWIASFVDEKGLDADTVRSKVTGSLGLAESSLDYVAAALDASTAYFSHTGTQTVARVLIQNAYKSVKDDVWREHVDSLS